MTSAYPIDDCRPGTWREQFTCPQGWRGWIVGWLMAVKNRERSQWVRSLVSPSPEDRVLEIGFGPGVDLRWAATRAAFTAGVDRSALMVRQARARLGNRAQVELANAESLPFPDAAFDKAYAINSAQFWKAEAFGEIRRVLRPGGTLYVAVQPRSKGANDETSAFTAERLRHALETAGFTGIEIHRKPMRPVSTVCVIGRRA